MADASVASATAAARELGIVLVGWIHMQDAFWEACTHTQVKINLAISRLHCAMWFATVLLPLI